LEHFKKNISIFRCPNCKGALLIQDNKIKCANEGLSFNFTNNVPDFFIPNDWNKTKEDSTEEIKAFYEKTPFPNYQNIESIYSLIEKARTGGFAKLLDEQIPFKSRILDIGCGTGQLSNFLSVADRSIFGVDMCRNSLILAELFRKKNNLDRVGFYQMNLFQPALKQESFDLVICNGVLHHTADPFKGFQSIAQLVKKDGFIMLGLYNKYGRITNDLRKLAFSLFNDKPTFLDSRIRKTKMKGEKLNAWINDQYHNPHETKHSLSEVLSWFQKLNFEFVNSIPTPGLITKPINQDLFQSVSAGNPFTRFFAQAGILFSPDNEGGFFIVIGKRK